MKHAFLILAHNNFASLERLVSELDYPDNDIFIHIDSKCKRYPQLHVSHAGLQYTTVRVDVRWGDYSVVQAEYELFRTARAKGPYPRYHLLSGVDVTLKSQEQIHSFFDSFADREFIGYTLLEPTPELVRKVNRLHLFPHSFQNASFTEKALRHLFIRLQEISGIKRNHDICFKKGSQWISVTDSMASLFLENEQWAKRTFSHTFCADEIVFQTLCWNSPLKDNIYSLESDAQGCMRAISWVNGEMRSWSKEQIEDLRNGRYMFARKHTQAASVSILVPAYNSEKTIAAALDSILAQDYPNIQVCIVNDCSTDGTSSEIEHYKPMLQSKGFSVEIVCNNTNLGAAASRNRLLSLATGTYVMFADSDDTLAPGMVSKAVRLAEENNCDIVGWDWTLSDAHTSRYMKQPGCHSPRQALTSLMSGTMRWNLWLFMFRRQLFNGFMFTPGMNMGEDMMCVLSLMNRAQCFCQLHESLYRYSQTDSSISRSMTGSNMRQVTDNLEKVESMLKKDNHHCIPARYLEFLKLNIKLPLLVRADKHDYICWSKWFSASNRYIILNRALPFRTRLLQIMAQFRLWPLVSLYDRLVYKHAYRLLFNNKKQERQ